MTFESIKHAAVATAISIAVMTMPVIAAAQAPVQTGFPPAQTGTGASVNNGSSPATCGGGPCLFSNPLGSTTSLCGLLKKLFEAAITIAIPVAVLFIIWSGFKFVLAQGNPKELAKARSTFYNTIIGIAIFLGSWLIATVIAAMINSIGGANIISCS